MGFKNHVSNEVIMDAVRLNASTAYQDRVPSATVSGIGAVAAALDKYHPFWNEFCEVLLNTIAQDAFQKYAWTNPLARFEQSNVNGSTLREMSVELIKARNYSKLGADVFSGQVPKVNVHYHYQNRQDQYDLEINRELLSQAMNQGNGLSELLSEWMDTTNRSNTVDTYLIERQVIGEYFAHNNSSVYNVQVPDILTATDKEEAGKAIAYELTRIAGLMAFPTSATRFIPNGNPGVGRETVLWVCPDVYAAFNTYVLPYAFNNGTLKLEGLATSMQVIDQWPQGVPAGTQCVLADSRWCIFAPTLSWTDSIKNPKSGSFIVYASFFGIYSASRMVPVVRFSTDATTSDAGLTPTYTALNLTGVRAANGTVAAPTHGTGNAWSTTQKAYKGADTFVTWEVTGNNQPNSAALATLSGNTSSNTFVDNSGKLFVASEETATSLKVTFTSVFAPSKVAELTISVE